eukprot:scaffold149807_cov30-Tisochrysis_lutea.AAC.2
MKGEGIARRGDAFARGTTPADLFSCAFREERNAHTKATRPKLGQEQHSQLVVTMREGRAQPLSRSQRQRTLPTRGRLGRSSREDRAAREAKELAVMDCTYARREGQRVVHAYGGETLAWAAQCAN